MKVKLKNDGMTIKFKYEELEAVLQMIKKKAGEKEALDEVNRLLFRKPSDIETVTSPDYISNITKEINETQKKIVKETKENMSKKEKDIAALKQAVASKNHCSDYEEYQINRQIVKLRDKEGLSFAKIGKQVGFSAATVATRYRKTKGDSGDDERVKT